MNFSRTGTLAVLLTTIAPFALAAPGAGSAYNTDAQSSHVQDATSDGIGQVNMIACIMAAMRPEALVNEGNYIALVDESKCEPEGRSSSAGSGDSAQAATFMTAVVNASRASNSDPMISKIWILQQEEGHQTNIDVHVSATAGPSAANPYGSFRLDFCGAGETAGSCRMNGYLEGSDSGIRYFQTETRDDGNGVQTQTTALQLNATGTTAGSGRLQTDNQNGQGGIDAFDFAYNATLFRRSDGVDDQCFSRDASDPDTGLSVWRYGLYDATTGARVTRNSGFPIEYTTGGQAYHGYLGYYGLSLPPDVMNALTSGSTVQKVDYNGSGATKTDFTVVKAAGKLIKFTRQTRKLDAMDGIKFSTFVGNDVSGFFSGAAPNTQYEMYWDDATGRFIVTAQMMCDQNGCHTEALDTEHSVGASFWQSRGGVQGWSQSLGGELFIALAGSADTLDSSAIDVAYRTQDLVYPSDLPATLYCVRDCPTGDSLTSYFAQGSQDASPYAGVTANNFNATPQSDVVTYHTDAEQALLLDAANEAVTFTDAEAYSQRPQYQWGNVRTGRLFETLAGAQCDSGSNTYCDWKINDLEVYYQWETGANSYSQFAAVKDSSDEFVKFDAPLQVAFTVPNGAAYGAYAGQSLVLQYGGFGDLWGIPGQCVSRLTNAPTDCNDQSSRYVAAFAIPFDATLGRVSDGANTYLVKWLDREIRFASKSISACTAANLELPSNLALPTSADLKNPSASSSDIYIGVKPEVTDAPRVIHGDVKF